MSSHWHALIMAGGKGERFWPWSRGHRPKQLLPLFGKATLIEQTVARLLPLMPRKRIWIVTNASQARAMARRMPRFPKDHFLVEPVGRDSSGAVMLGCATIARRDPRAVMALLPADHLIHDVRAYVRALADSFRVAERTPCIVTLGIKPTSASSAYGYIERAGPMRLPGVRTRIFHGRRFLEKPNAAAAARFVRSGRHVWNAGMFLWSATTIRDAFRAHSPVHAAGWDALVAGPRQAAAYLRRGWRALPKISIDYSVMEKTRNFAVVEGGFDWDDVGSWTALAKHFPPDKTGNRLRGRVVSVNSRDCLVLGGTRAIGLLGVRDLIVVQTEDATLVCARDAAQRVKELVKLLPAKLR
ncbi:MAG: mannose-1-phosphate guanylyltransferase [Verrucomicrobiae bacterium]|nr:mannose-1-phosphate guanylyltransferase [Verrucomicrobiae bacterium]